MMKILALLFAACATLPAQAPKLKQPPDKCAQGFATINVDDAHRWLERLAGEEFEGRETGSPGFQKAADFVAGNFKGFGLQPVGDKGEDGNPTYFQQVPFVAAGSDDAASFLELSGGGAQVKLKLGEGFGVHSSGGGAEIDDSGNLAMLAADGESAKIENVELQARVVIVAPHAGRAEGVARLPKFLDSLKKLKPKAVLLIDDVRAAQGSSPGGWERKDKAVKPGASGSGRPKLYVSEASARKLVAAAGLDWEKIVSESRARNAPIAKTSLKSTARVVLKSKIVEKGVPNVVGFLEGSDPKLKSEVVIVGSHLDHLGRKGETYYPGADDDGSGSTGVLEVSRAFTKNGAAPKRSLLFITVCGEEEGLLGSDWYVEHPIFPIKDSVAELQMDMIGRREEGPLGHGETADQNKNTLKLVGSKRLSTQLHDAILKLNSDHVGFDFEYDNEDVYFRSDHYNFARKGIPITFFFSGFHNDYHQPSDTPEKIDYEKLVRVAKLVYLTAWEVADRPTRLVVDKTPKAPK